MTFGHSDETSAENTPELIQDRERRRTLRALKIWNDAREGNDFPYLAKLTVKPDMMDEREIFTENQFLIMFEAHTSNSVVIFYGGNLPNTPNRRKAGNAMQQALPASLQGIFRDACLKAVDKGDAVHRHGVITAPCGDSVLYRGIFMPLRSDSQPDRIYVFGAFSNEEGGAELLAAA